MQSIDKTQFYIDSLTTLIINDKLEYVKLYNWINKEKDIEAFKDFCAENYDKWKLEVDILYDYFK